MNDRLREIIAELRKPVPDNGSGSRYHEGYNDACNDVADELEKLTRAQASAQEGGDADRTVEDDMRDFGTGYALDGRRIDPSRLTLYTSSNAKAGEVEKDSTGDAIQRAAAELPDGYVIEIGVEHHAGWIDLIDPEGYKIDFSIGEDGIASAVTEALNAALSTQRGDGSESDK